MKPKGEVERIDLRDEPDSDDVVILARQLRNVLEASRAPGSGTDAGRGDAPGDDPADALIEVISQLTQHLSLVLISIDAEGRFEVVRGAGLERLGVTEERLVGTPVTDWGDAAAESFTRASTGTPNVFDADGVVGGVSFRYRVVLLPNGEGGAIGAALDLSEVLDAQRAAIESEELLQSAIRALDAGFVVQGADGTVLSHNPAAAALLGAAPDGLVGRRTDAFGIEILHEDGRVFAADDLPGRTALRTGEPQRNVVIGARPADSGDEPRSLVASSYPMHLGTNDVVLTLLTERHDPPITADGLRDSEDRFRLLAESAPLGIFIRSDGGPIVYVNPQIEEQTGRTLQEINRIGWLECFHVDDRERLLEDQTSFREAGVPFLHDYRAVAPGGAVRWLRIRYALLRDDEGEPIGVVGTSADVTDYREAEQRLRESEERTPAILETAAEGIVTIDETEHIVEFNAAAERIFGYDSDEMIGTKQAWDLLAPPERDTFRRVFREYVAGTGPNITEMTPRETVGVREDGSTFPVEVAITEVEMRGGRLYTALIRDMSEHKAFEMEVEHLTTHDTLTGLPNMALLTAQLEAALVRANRRSQAVAVLLVDIDRVKLVSETLGHRAGDDLMLQASRRLRAVGGSRTTVGRFSNDQFVVYLEDLVSVNDAVDLATQIIEAVNEPFLVAGDEAFVNASVGVAFVPNGMSTAENLITNASVAMGRAKTGSVTRYEIFDSEMRALADHQRRTEIALRHGIQRNELHYQPVVTLPRRDSKGFEALVRWNHPTQGLLPPDDFIPLAEDTGLIVPLGEWVIRQACRQLAAWKLQTDGPPPFVAVNLSAHQLVGDDLSDIVRAAVDETGADPTRLTFEITESVLLSDVDAAAEVLGQLKDIGVRIALDDFGTGFSSLTYLRSLPIDIVKIDRSFVSQLGTGSRDESIVGLVVRMADTLGLDVVAEGVETEEQAEALQQLGCPHAQGYLFARPQPLHAVELALDLEADELLDELADFGMVLGIEE